MTSFLTNYPAPGAKVTSDGVTYEVAERLVGL